MPHESPDFEARIHELLDDRRAPEEDAWCQSQAALSVDAKQLLVAQQLMLDGLELSEVPDLPADFAQTCVASALSEADTRPAAATATGDPRRQGWQIPALAVGVAIALALAIPLYGWLAGNDPTNSVAENASEVESDENDPDSEIPPVEVPNHENSVDESDRIENESIEVVDGVDNPAASDVAQDDAGHRDANTIEPEAIEGDYRELTYEDLDLYAAFRGLRDRIPQTERDEHLIAALDDMATGLRPVADSVGGAINALRRNLPPSPKADEADKPQAWMPTEDGTILS